MGKSCPYNAAQAMRVRGKVDFAAVARAWADAIEAAGLGRVSVDPANGRCFRHETLNGEMARYPVRMLPAGLDRGLNISTEVEPRHRRSRRAALPSFCDPGPGRSTAIECRWCGRPRRR